MNLNDTIDRINRMRDERIIGDFAIGGAVAAGFYIEAAATEDVDVFAALSEKGGLIDLDPIFAYARARGYPKLGPYIVIGGWKVQFLPAGTPLVQEAIDQAVHRSAGDLKIRLFSPEHVVAVALQVGRPKDLTRIAQFLEADNSKERKRRFDEAKLTDILARHNLMDKWLRVKRQLGM